MQISWQPQSAGFEAGAALCEPQCADFVLGAALGERRSADFVAGTVLGKPRSADFIAAAARSADFVPSAAFLEPGNADFAGGAAIFVFWRALSDVHSRSRSRSHSLTHSRTHAHSRDCEHMSSWTRKGFLHCLGSLAGTVLKKQRRAILALELRPGRSQTLAHAWPCGQGGGARPAGTKLQLSEGMTYWPRQDVSASPFLHNILPDRLGVN